MTPRRGVITPRIFARGIVRDRHLPRSRRGSSTRAAQEAVGPLRQLGGGRGFPGGRGGRGVARLFLVGGEEGCPDRRRVRDCHHARRGRQAQRGGGGIRQDRDRRHRR